MQSNAASADSARMDLGRLPRILRWALPLTLLGLLLVLYLGRALLDWQVTLPGNHFMLGVCSLWVVFSVTRALYTDALIKESQKRQQLIEVLDSTRRELMQHERRAGVLMERQRLARELHDTLAQSFAGIVLHLEAAEQALPAQREAAERHIVQARASARSSLQEVRRLLSALRPGLLEKTSLAEAILAIVQHWNEEHEGVAVKAIVNELGFLHPEVEVTLLRAVQEALANVHKHARATHVEVQLLRDTRAVELTVSDDGIGFPEGAAPEGPGGYGLMAMRQRVEQLGGELRCENRGGAQVSMRLPIAGAVALVDEAGAA